MFLDFLKIYKNLGLKKGQIIIIASDILRLSIIYKRKKEKFDGNKFIDQILEYLGPEGTLLINAFNWDYCHGKKYDPKISLAKTGSLGNLAIKRSDFKRSQNPIYSFMVKGYHAKDITNMRHSNCFDIKSPFGFMIKNKAKYLFVDIDYKKTGFPLVHVAEQTCKVPYRYFKNFKIKFLGKQNKIKKIKMFVKNLKFKFDIKLKKRMDYELKKINGIKRVKINKINFTLLDCNKAYKLMKSDLLKKEYKLVNLKKNNV